MDGNTCLDLGAIAEAREAGQADLEVGRGLLCGGVVQRVWELKESEGRGIKIHYILI